MATQRYYLAYGSNLHVAQMQRRCPGAKAVGTAWLDGYRLEFRGSKTGAYLTVTQDLKARTPVGVWEITAEHERALDQYEGYPVFYYKRRFAVEVTPLSGKGKPKTVTAMVYIMDEARPLGTPAQWYVGVCSVGYDCFGFDKATLLDAVKRSLPAATKYAGKAKRKDKVAT